MQGAGSARCGALPFTQPRHNIRMEHTMTELDTIISTLKAECVFALHQHDKNRLVNMQARLQAAEYVKKTGASAKTALTLFLPTNKRKARKH